MALETFRVTNVEVLRNGFLSHTFIQELSDEQHGLRVALDAPRRCKPADVRYAPRIAAKTINECGNPVLDARQVARSIAVLRPFTSR